MRKIIIALLTLTAITAITACQKTTTSNDDWPKQMPFDGEAYDRSYDVYSEHYDDGIEGIPTLKIIADSMMKEAKKTDNYPMEINAIMMLSQIEELKGNNEKVLQLHKDAMDIAKKNGHKSLYFTMYNGYCQVMLDSSTVAGVHEVKQMINEAQKLGNYSGLKNGHRLLGEIFEYHYENSNSALKEYLLTEELAKKGNSTEEYMFDLHMSMALTYIRLGKIEEAEKIFEEARNSEAFSDEYCRTSYYLTYLNLVEKTGTDEEFDRIYREYFSNSGIRARYSNEDQLQWEARWHIKMHEFDKALEVAGRMENEAKRYNVLIKTYKAMGMYDKAIECYERLENINDSLTSELNMSELAEMDAQLNNAALRREMAANIAHRNYIIFSLAILLLIIVIGYTVMRSAKQKRQNRKLREKLENR